jgi:hypothetical protein
MARVGGHALRCAKSWAVERSTDQTQLLSGSACGPVIVPVFKTGGRRVTPSPVGSTPTRFRHFFSIICKDSDGVSDIGLDFGTKIFLRPVEGELFS